MAVQELVYPPLVDLLAGPEAGRAEAYTALLGEVTAENAGHFVAALAAAVQPYEAGSQTGGPLTAVRAARAAGEALAAALQRLGVESTAAERLARRAAWHEELATEGGAWAGLTSLADLPRLAAVLAPGTAEQITGTLASLLPTLELQAPLNPPLATTYFECVLTYGRLPTWPPAVAPLLATLATSPAFTPRQQARLARLTPLAPVDTK